MLRVPHLIDLCYCCKKFASEKINLKRLQQNQPRSTKKGVSANVAVNIGRLTRHLHVLIIKPFKDFM